MTVVLSVVLQPELHRFLMQHSHVARWESTGCLSP